MTCLFLLCISLILATTPFVHTDSCSGATTCESCTKAPTCVWCTQPNGTSPDTSESYTVCVKGSPAGKDNGNTCEVYYWAQCTVSSIALGNDQTYIISIGVIGVIIIIIVVSVVTIIRVCKRKGKENKVKNNYRPPTTKKSNPTTRKHDTITGSAVVRLNDSQDQLHRTLLRNCLDNAPKAVEMRSPSQQPTVTQQPIIQQPANEQPTTEQLATVQQNKEQAPTEHRTSVPLNNQQQPVIQQPQPAELETPDDGKIDLLEESKKIAADLDDIFRELEEELNR